uniref:Activin_recp domain-containing protein n=1 Tax=Ascaris lumbricoides TaxID=6252 RepID=A0A0M3I9W3_ASCLU
MRICVSALRCYHGANVAFPENNLMKTLKVVECGPLASFCRRAYGLINAKEGWILSCMAKTSLGADYCVKGSECIEVNSGEGKSLSHYMDCCCASDMCNDDTLGTALQQGDFLKLSNMSANHFLRITEMIVIVICLITLYLRR